VIRIAERYFPGRGLSACSAWGHVTLQAKREGYVNKTIDVEVSRTTTHDFDLIPTRTRSKLDGQYGGGSGVG